MRAVVNTLLLLFIVAVIGLNVFLRIDPAKRNYELFPQMVHSVPFDSFEANPNFPDGMTLRQPVRGTVIRGRMPLHYAATPADAQRAGIELVSNVRAGDARALARGQWVYEQFCMTCHGAAGKGDGTVATRGFPAPPSLLAPHALQMRDGQMFHVITYGQNNMPSYAPQVERDDRWRAIAYVRTLQGAGAAAAPQTGTAPLNAAPVKPAPLATQQPLAQSPAEGRRVS